MKIETSFIPGILVISPNVFHDHRGYFFESFNQKEFNEETNLDVNFIQDGESYSHKGVIRGIHFQSYPFEQNKLVRVIEGEVLDVVVDLRRESDYFGKYFSRVLSGENKTQLFIPKGFGHAFLCLSDYAILAYKVDEIYSSANDRTILWSDPNLNIDWKIDDSEVKISDKDKNGESFISFVENYD